MTTTSTSATPHTSAEDTNHGARSAVFHISRPCCRPKIQAVTECTRMAHTSAMALITRRDAAEPLPPSKRSVAHRYAMERTR